MITPATAANDVPARPEVSKIGITGMNQIAPPGADAPPRERRLICPPLVSTPAGAGPTRGRSRRRTLPDDLLKQASQRLEAIALLAAVIWILATVLYHLIDLKNAGITNWTSFQSSDILVGVGAAMSLSMYFYVRRASRDPRFVLDLGLAFLIATSMLIGLILH